jgi:nucleotide-binding universal stress UspA family protein
MADAARGRTLARMTTSERPHGAGPTIVVGYDGSPPSRAAVSWAVRRAGVSGRLILVNAGRRRGGLLDRPSFEVWVRDRLAFGHALIDELVLERDDVAGANIEVEVVDDFPVPVLLEAARKYDADEIVIGTRHRGRFAALHGSVARELLNEADRPVVLVPPYGLAQAARGPRLANA